MWGWVGGCLCKVTCGSSVNVVTPEKRTSEKYNFASTLAIEMYLGKHIYIYTIRAIRLRGISLTVYVVSKEMNTQARKVGT